MLDAAGPIAAFEIAGALRAGRLRPRDAGAEPRAGAQLVRRRHDRRRPSSGASASTRWSSPAATARGAPFAMQRFSPSSARSGGERAAHGQRLLRRLHPRRGRPARRPARHHPLEAHRRLRPALSRRCGWSRTASLCATARVWTSAGITAGIDLALAMIAEDLGEDDRPADRPAAGGLSPPAGRPVAVLRAAGAGAARRPLRPAARLGARAAATSRSASSAWPPRRAMSPRNFARAFAAETGVTPARAIERLRVEAARERIEGRRSRSTDRAGVRLRRPRAHAPRLPARLRPAAAGAAPPAARRETTAVTNNGPGA